VLAEESGKAGNELEVQWHQSSIQLADGSTFGSQGPVMAVACDRGDDSGPRRRYSSPGRPGQCAPPATDEQSPASKQIGYAGRSDTKTGISKCLE